MVAVPAHRLEDFAQALVIADVVAYEVRKSHDCRTLGPHSNNKY
jgi:hypothetical protein